MIHFGFPKTQSARGWRAAASLMLAVAIMLLSVLGGLSASLADAPPSQVRFGIAMNSNPHDYPRVADLKAGWYHNWSAHPYDNQAVAGLQFVPTVGAWGPLMGGDTEQDLRDFITVSPESYPSGTIWIVGNELDLDRFSTPQGSRIITPTEYAQKYKKYYDMIKGIDASYRVGVGCEITYNGLLSTARTEYERLYGAKMPIDVYTMHAYLTAGDLLTQVKNRVKYTRELMDSYGDQDKWLIVTETGALATPGDAVVQQFMREAFDYYATATSTAIAGYQAGELGCPSDDDKLVQRWAWFAATARDPGTASWRWQGSKLLHSTAAEFVDFPSDPMYNAALDGQLSPVGQEYAAYVKAPPTLPSSYWGEANINGEPVTVGTVVTAWVDNVQVSSAVTQSYNGRTVYSLDIPADDPDTPEIDGCTAGDIVRFKLGSLNASTTSLWQSGMSVHLDLNRVIYTHAPLPWILGYGPAAGGWTSQDIFPRMMGDVNGDGRDDIVAFGNRSLYVSLSNGAGFARAVPWINAYGPAAGGWTSYDVFPRCTGDVNGDGMDDIVAFGNRATYVSLSTGSKFMPPKPWIAAYGPASGGWTTQDRYPRVLGDVNGDGKDDILAFGENGVFVSLSTGTGFTAPRIWVYAYGRGAVGGWWTSYDQYPRTAADVNGDGRDDIIGFGNRATFVSLSTGTGFTAPVEWIFGYGADTSAGGWSSFNLFPRVVSDINGDGRADVVAFGSSATYASFSDGSGFDSPVAWVYNYGTQAGGWSSYNIFPRMTGDLNADGRQDIVGFGNRATYVSVTNSGNLSATSLARAALAASADDLDPWTALVLIDSVPLGPENEMGDTPAAEVDGGWIQAGDAEEVPAGEADQELPTEAPEVLPELLPKEDISSPRDARDSARGVAVR